MKPPPLSASAIRILEIALGQMLWSRRSVFLGLLVAGPVVLAIAIRVATMVSVDAARPPRAGGPFLFGLMVWLFYVRFIIPVLGVFYGTALVADEVEDKTITYLFVRPIPRAAVLLGKYLAFLACTALLVLPTLTLVYLLVVPVRGASLGPSFPAVMADLGVCLAGLAAYGAVFAFVGARFKRPLTTGLVFAFGWEPGVLLFPGYLKGFTVAYYLQGLVPHAMPSESATSILLRIVSDVPSLPACLAALTLITVVMLWSAARAVANREYVLDQ